MAYFLGTYENTIDDNNRLSIPAKYRKIMEDLGHSHFFITKEPENYLTLYPNNVWNARIGAKIADLPHGGPKAKRFRRLIGANTTEINLDNQGRINIPTDYYKHAGIEKKVKIIGAVDTLQLWNPESYDEISQEPEEQSIREEFEEFGI
ncbi:MAG: division/cell wall cluster transcriptional repressor MraZ [bacterium]